MTPYGKYARVLPGPLGPDNTQYRTAVPGRSGEAGGRITWFETEQTDTTGLRPELPVYGKGGYEPIR